MHDLTPLNPGYSAANAINNKGQITGWMDTTFGQRAFFYDGAMHTLPSPFADNTIGESINDKGWIAGTAYNTGNGGQNAFLYDGSTHYLGSLGGTLTNALGINNIGQVIGSSFLSGNLTEHAFLYTDGAVLDLNNFVSPAQGLTLTIAEGINDSGWITGIALVDGQRHAFLAIPVPEPSALALTIFGLLSLALLARRRVRSRIL
jgi:probable HAF family extracellular repeat protein